MIINGLVFLVLNLITIILLPLDLLINQFIPDMSSYTQAIIDLFDLITSYVGWFLNAIGLNGALIAFIIAFWTFKLTTPAIAWAFKLVFKWWRAIKG